MAGVRAVPRSDSVRGYVPRLLAQRLIARGPIDRFEWTAAPAAVLLTDIAGFTEHVERLTASRDGLDELAAALDAYYAELVGIVYAHGGDVLAIAGDAFFSYWPASRDDGLGLEVLRAAEAGIAIQAALGAGPDASGRPFATRIGIAAGELGIAIVGGVNGRWELMPAGSPVGDVARAERAARRGTVVLAPAAWAEVAPHCEGREVGRGLVELEAVRRPAARPARPPATDVPEELLGPFVPLPVRQRRPASRTEWLAELRRVTVVMTGVPELGGTEERQLESGHRAVRAFQEVMARFEGAAKLLVDNKGVALSGVFGLPPRAHENDPVRAVRAAEALAEELHGLGLACGIGIATGRAFCGVFGSDLRREYTLHGDAMNVAARLMQAGAGEILCDESTVAATRGRRTFEALQTLRVRGRAQPVRIHRPRPAAQSTAGAEPPIVGRTAERELLRSRIDALVRDGRADTLVIEGEAGLGKSRLAAEAAALARARGVPVLAAAADALERATSYYAWRQTFADLLGGAPEAERSGAQAPLLREVARDGELARLLPLLNGVVPVGIPENELTSTMAGQVRADNTRTILLAVLRHATAGAPALLVVEDAHWLDSSSWALLTDVAESLPRLMIVITTRPAEDELPSDYRRLLARQSIEVTRLERLTAQDTHALLAQRLGVQHLPPALAHFVEERVAGHPFFCEELLQTMREAGVVEVRNGAAVVGDLDVVQVPATVEAAVLSRLDRLSGEELLCLKVAAVIGRSFWSRTVRDALPVAEERIEVDEHLDRLAQLDLTAIDAPDPDRSYAFRHEITRDVAYDLLTAAQRRQLHRAVALWHERTYTPEELAPHLARLAHHWARADDPTKTVEYLERAGLQAVHRGAFREALVFLSEPIEIHERTGVEPDSVRRAVWEHGLGTAHYFLGELGESRALLERAVARVDREVPPSRVGLAAAILAAAGVQAAHLVRPRRYFQRRHAEKAVLDQAVSCYKILGQIYYLDGEPAARLLYTALAGLNLGEEAGPSPQLARMLIHAAVITSIMGLNGSSDRYAARAIVMTEDRAHGEAGAYVWSIRALIEAQRGRWASAKEANQRALDRIGEVGDYNLEAEVWQTRSAIHICEGDLSAAERAWRRTRELAERNGNPQVMCWSLLDEVETRIGRDETGSAAEVLEAALAVPTAETDGSSAIEKHYATALVRAAQGRREEAVRAADAVVEMVAGRLPTAFHWVDFCAGAVEVYLHLLEQTPAPDGAHLERSAARGARLVRRISRQFGNVRPRAWLLQGMVEWQRGRPDRAFKHWRRADEVAIRMDMPFERARARLELARHDGAGVDRSAYLAFSADTFARLGATRLLRHAHEAGAD